MVFIHVRGVRFPYGLQFLVYNSRGYIEKYETRINGPFVYRLGRMVFIHVRGVRFPYGLQFL
nr:hypothetical protein [uncultured bacterium]